MKLLGSLAEVRMGYSFRSRLEPDATGEVAVIQMKDIDDTNLVHAEHLVRVQVPDLKSHHLIKPGDLLFRSRGTTNSAALVGADLGQAVLAAPMLLIRPTTDALDPAYLQWLINHPATQADLASQAAGTAVKMIGASVLFNLLVTVPPLATQRHIVEAARLASRESALLDRLKERRKTLIDSQLLRYARQSQ
jgi:Type I restriction modification DNA specificity domain